MSTADIFCSTGGYSGTSFSPLPKTKCRTVKDPYAGLPVPGVSGCDFTNMTISTGTVNLRPGIYCGGLHMRGGTVNFAPGVYVIKDGILKTNGADLYGTDITFYFYGDTSVLQFNAGAKVELSAPKTGPYAGLIFVQDPDFGSGKVSRLNGHSDTKIVGVGYFPTQKVSVGGSGIFGVLSPFMAFVADELEFHGNGQIKVSMDATAAGYTMQGPREYLGSRLTD